jgi:hypothetical protein
MLASRLCSCCIARALCHALQHPSAISSAWARKALQFLLHRHYISPKKRDFALPRPCPSPPFAIGATEYPVTSVQLQAAERRRIQEAEAALVRRREVGA